MQAGQEIFASRGFEGATTRAIAERAGVALASLPYHFKTKEALWKAVVDDIFGRFATQMSVARSEFVGDDPREQTRLRLAAYIRFVAENPAILQIGLMEGISANSRTKWLIEKHLRPNFEYVNSERRRAEALGFGISAREEHFYYMIIGAAGLPYAVQSEFRSLVGREATDPELVEAHIEAVLDLFYP